VHAHGAALANPAELQNLRWTKLNPPRIATDVVRRARVRERLERGLHRPVTLVCAPAGYGKTTLLSDWLAGSGYPYIWLSLDESDSDLAVFLNYFVAAIRTAYPNSEKIKQFKGYVTSDDRGTGQFIDPLPLETGRTFLLAPDEPERLVKITSNDADIMLFDGRILAQNGWFVVRSLLPAGKQARF
jgi:hypothetical protein